MTTELDRSQHCQPRAVDQHDARQRAFDAAEEGTR
jgi:hypothetical protein